MSSWLPSATSALNFVTAAIALTVAVVAIARKNSKNRPPDRGDKNEETEDDQ
jgi:hypothetical protein